MKWTNNHNLPQPVVELVTKDKYSKGDAAISITGLNQPPRARVLIKEHQDEITADVSDRIPALLGKLMHKLLEEANSVALAEKRFYLEIEGLLISGQTDAFYLDGVLDDYKLLPIRKVNNGEIDLDFIAQLNCYAYLVKHGFYINDQNEKITLGITVKSLRIIGFFRDWFKAGILKAKHDGFYYPAAQCQVFEVPIWEDGKTLLYLKDRIEKHKAANKKLPRCTDEERWAEPDKYAVIKDGAKKSVKNHLDHEDAEDHANRLGTKYSVEIRKGGSKRCADWCDAKDFCTQYQKEIKPYE